MSNNPNNINEESTINPQILMEQNHKYFLEFSKLNDANGILIGQLNTLAKEKNLLKNTVQKLEAKSAKNGVESIKINDTYTNRRVIYHKIFC